MIKKITLLFGLLISIAAFSQETGCSKFKNGIFRVTDPKSKKVCIITRDGNVQTEKMEDNDEVYDFDIVWLDDCTYTVTPTAATAARNKNSMKAGTMTVRITNIKGNTYIQKITVANNPKFRRMDEVFLLEEKK